MVSLFFASLCPFCVPQFSSREQEEFKEVHPEWMKRTRAASLPCRPCRKCPPPLHRPEKQEARRPSPACPCRRPGVCNLEFSLLRERLAGQCSSLLTEIEGGALQARLRGGQNGETTLRIETSRPSTIGVVVDALHFSLLLHLLLRILPSYLRRRGPCLRRRRRRRAVDLHLVLVRRHFDGEVRENERVEGREEGREKNGILEKEEVLFLNHENDDLFLPQFLRPRPPPLFRKRSEETALHSNIGEQLVRVRVQEQRPQRRDQDCPPQQNVKPRGPQQGPDRTPRQPPAADLDVHEAGEHEVEREREHAEDGGDVAKEGQGGRDERAAGAEEEATRGPRGDGRGEAGGRRRRRSRRRSSLSGLTFLLLLRLPPPRPCAPRTRRGTRRREKRRRQRARRG